MSQETKNKIALLFAQVVAGVFVFMIASVTFGFVSARLMGLPVDVDKFYAMISQPISMILGAILGFIAGGGKTAEKDEL